MNCPNCGSIEVTPSEISHINEWVCGSWKETNREAIGWCCSDISRLKAEVAQKAERVLVLEDAIERAQKFSAYDGAAYEILEQALAGGKGDV